MSSFPPSTTTPAERLPIRTKAAWGAGGIVDNLMINGMGALMLPIYNIALGVNPIYLGYALLVPRLLDAIFDPLIGNWSDNTRSRWGRRRPFIVVGALVMTIACVLLWMPPLRWGESALLVYFAVVSTILYLSFAVFAIPWSAWGYELTTDYHERTRVMAWRMYFAYAAGFATPWLYKLTLLPLFSPSDTGGIPPEVFGVQWVACIVAVICLVAALVPVIFCRERPAYKTQSATPIWESMRLTFQNRAFLFLCAITVIVISGLVLSGPFLLYLNIFYVMGGDKNLAGTLAGWSGMVGTISGLASMPLLVGLAGKIGKKNTMMAGQAAAMLGYALSWFCITPSMPYLQMLPALLIFPGLNAVWLLNQSVMADICDLDELRSGKRREGMFGASMALIFKVSFAVGPVLVGYLLVWSGFAHHSATQSESVLWNMRLFYVAIPIVCLAASIYLTRLLPISEEGMRQVRIQLEQRSSNPS